MIKKHHLHSKSKLIQSTHLRFKANLLLKCSKELSIKKVLWRWYLASSGRKMMRRMSSHLVLNSNINKTTFFYRLKGKLKVKTMIESWMKRKESNGYGDASISSVPTINMSCSFANSSSQWSGIDLRTSR